MRFKDTEGGIRSCSLQRSSANFVAPPSWRPVVVGAGVAMGATVTTGRVSVQVAMVPADCNFGGGAKI